MFEFPLSVFSFLALLDLSNKCSKPFHSFYTQFHSNLRATSFLTRHWLSPVIIMLFFLL